MLIIIFLPLPLIPCIAVLNEDYSTTESLNVNNRFSLALLSMVNAMASFSVTITSDQVVEGDHLFSVSFIEVTTGDGYIIEAEIGDSPSTSVTITDVTDGEAV